MRYYIDTEFIEGPQTKRFLGMPVGKTKPTIDLISIGIKAEDGRSYYAICKDFNLREAWDRYDIQLEEGVPKKFIDREYWLRENVLSPIYDDMFDQLLKDVHLATGDEYVSFNYRNFKKLLNRYGKTKGEIASEIYSFLGESTDEIKFYGYYSDYDWVVFCWLFGLMKDLPKCFPMYCRDLKQTLDETKVPFLVERRDKPGVLLKVLDTIGLRYRVEVVENAGTTEILGHVYDISQEKVSVVQSLDIRLHKKYPKQSEKAHHALRDAEWIHELFKFLEAL